MRCKGKVMLGLGFFYWSFACSQVLLWAYGATFMPCGIRLANKFQNSKKGALLSIKLHV